MDVITREGSIQFSIEVEKETPDIGVAETRSLGREYLQRIERLHRIFGEFAIPLTWFVPGPQTLNLTSLTTTSGHDEIAWSPRIVASAAPPRLREIKEQIATGLAGFQQAGVSIQSCLLPESWGGPQPLDWLAEGGVHVIRAPRSLRQAPRQPRLLREGMWQVAAAATLPGYGRGFGMGALDSGFVAKQAILRAVQGDQAVHITIPLESKAIRTERFWGPLRRILHRVHRLRLANRLRCTTLTQTPELLTGNRSTVGRSILRAA
jgi:hypothetical protein